LCQDKIDRSFIKRNLLGLLADQFAGVFVRSDVRFVVSIKHHRAQWLMGSAKSSARGLNASDSEFH
jgi:hypothetical protein